LVAILVIALVIPQQVVPVLATGVYTTSAVDANGNTLLANNTVNDTQYYDTTKDASAATQQQLGTDPNWRNGVTRQSYAIKFSGNTDYVDVPTASDPDLRSATWSVSAWVKYLGSPADSAAFSGLFERIGG